MTLYAPMWLVPLSFVLGYLFGTVATWDVTRRQHQYELAAAKARAEYERSLAEAYGRSQATQAAISIIESAGAQ